MACLFLVVNEHELSPCFEFFGEYDFLGTDTT